MPSFSLDRILASAPTGTLAALADEPGTPAALRITLALRLVTAEALPRLLAVAGDTRVAVRHRITAIRAVAARNPEAVRPLLATVIRERWFPRPYRWMLLYSVLTELGRYGWPEFRTVSRTVEHLDRTGFTPLRWLRAATALSTRPALDGEQFSAR